MTWRRLSIRVVYLGLIRLAMSLVTGYFGVAWRDDPVWPLVLGAVGGLIGASADLSRWQTTRFLITPERVEMRTGWISRKHRTVARDRIRSVDSSARLIPRLLGLRTVNIGSGDAETSFQLDSLDRGEAERVQRELMPGRGSAVSATFSPAVTSSTAAPASPAVTSSTAAPASPASPASTAAPASPGEASAPASPGEASAPSAPPHEDISDISGMSDEAETVIARLRRPWIWLNAFRIESAFALIAPVFALHWALRPFGVDLFRTARDLFGTDLRGIVLILLIAVPLGFAVAAVAFVIDNWNFELVRTGGALITRKGLFTTTTVQRSDERTRGIAFAEPLLTRRLRVTKTKLLLTGSAAGEGGGDILPRTRLEEARDLAAQILPDGARPLEAPLRRHPRGALVRRIGWAVYTPVLLAAALLPFPLPGWVWPLPFLLIPVTVPLAAIAYRSLGHTVQDDYLVVRDGALTRRTVALQNRAVIGWSLEQSLFQRWAGRMTVGIATAAGSRSYEAPDVSVDQAMTLIAEATPGLISVMTEPPATSSAASPAVSSAGEVSAC